jgi:hypothetical protein
MLMLLSKKAVRWSTLATGTTSLVCALGFCLRTLDRYLTIPLGHSNEFPSVLRLKMLWEVEAWAYIALFLILGITLLKIARTSDR